MATSALRVTVRFLAALVTLFGVAPADGSPLFRGNQNWAQLFRFDPHKYDHAATNAVFWVRNNNANYDMIKPDYYERHPAASMPLQNFEHFNDPHMPHNTELNMDESHQFRKPLPFRPPQPLSEKERRIRQKLELENDRREKKIQLKLAKGTTKPKGHTAYQWEQFDYDQYTAFRGDKKDYIDG